MLFRLLHTFKQTTLIHTQPLHKAHNIISLQTFWVTNGKFIFQSINQCGFTFQASTWMVVPDSKLFKLFSGNLIFCLRLSGIWRKWSMLQAHQQHNIIKKKNNEHPSLYIKLPACKHVCTRAARAHPYTCTHTHTCKHTHTHSHNKHQHPPPPPPHTQCVCMSNVKIPAFEVQAPSLISYLL